MTDMSPIDWALRPLKNYATFSGRAPRAEFWWFMLFMMIVYFAMWFMLMAVAGGMAASQAEPSLGVMGALGAAGIFMMLFWLVMLVPTLAVQTRRLHDTNRSGWWLAAFYLLYLLYLVMTMAIGLGGAGAEMSGGGLAMFGVAMVVGLAFFVYSIVLLVFFCLPGSKGVNRYGADPYGAELDQVFA